MPNVYEIDVLALEARILFSGAPMGDGGEPLDAVNAGADSIDLSQWTIADPAHNISESGTAGEQDKNPTSTVDGILSDRQDGLAPEISRELIFIDTGVSGLDRLLEDIASMSDDSRSIEVIFLDPTRDGIEQISNELGSRNDIDSIHILSHGSNGQVWLGNTLLSSHNVKTHAPAIALWSTALDVDADILIYGCDLASNDAGRHLVDSIAALTQADVAASDDLTGHADLGGDWDLEYFVGTVENGLALSEHPQPTWQGLLATLNVTTTVDVINGDTSSTANLIASDGGDGISLREAIEAANNEGGNHTINLAAGTYNLNAGSGTTAGDLDILDHIVLVGAGADSTTIDAGMNDRVLHLATNGYLELSGVTLTGGSVTGDRGAGLLIENGGVAILDQVAIVGNQVSSSGVVGGGIYNFGTLTVTNSLLANNNVVGSGSAIGSASWATLNMANVTVSGNSASDNFAVYSSGLGGLTNVTITANTNGGFRSLDGSFTVLNTIISGNTGGDASGSYTDSGNNLIGVAAGLNALADNGGPTLTHSLQLDSAAIDGGSAVDAPATDQRGVSRDWSPDIGAYEIELLNPDGSLPTGQQVNEDEVLTFSAGNGNAVLVSDSLAGVNSRLQVDISASDGVLTLSQTTGLTFIEGSNGSGFMKIHGTESDINAAFGGMTFTPNPNFNGSVTLNMQTSLGADLRGNYTFEGGIADDQSAGITYDGTLNGNATTVNDAERGEVLSLDGNGDYVQVTGLLGEPTNVTLAAWINASSTDAAGAVVISMGTSPALYLLPDGKLIGYYWSNGSSNTITTAESFLGAGWKHVAVSIDTASLEMTVYVDGQAVQTIATSGAIEYNISPDTFIGRAGSGGPGYDFGGQIDDARIYGRALSAEEIAALAADRTTNSENVIVSVDAVNDQPTFDAGDGNVHFDFGSLSDSYSSVTVQPDGKTLAVGSGFNNATSSWDFLLVRYNVDGTLDTTFGGGDGIATLDLDTFDQGNDINLQEDGKILLTGYSASVESDFVLLRYNADGTLDTSFGAGSGIVISDLNAYDTAANVMTLPGGKILVLGTTDPGSGNAVTLLQYNSDGTLDTSFGTGGIVTTTVNGGSDAAQSLMVQYDGKLVVGVNGPSTEFTVLRYNADGTLDTSFGGGDGQVTNTVGLLGLARLQSMVVADDGSIFAGGRSSNGAFLSYTLLKYDSFGNLDTSFGVGGVAQISNGDIHDIRLQSDGKIVAVGGVSGGSFEPSVVRFNTDGTLDMGFGSGGQATSTVSSSGSFQGLDITPDGKIVAVGTQDQQAIIYRFNADGSLDSRFSVVNTLDGNPTFVEGGSPVVLDSDVSFYDEELSNGIDNFNNTTLTLSRNGGANADDVFSATGLLNPLSEGGSLVYNGVIVGTVTANSGGTLLLTFNGTADNDAVNNVMRSIAYSNTSDAPPASVQIDWSFNDHNNGGLQGSGGDAFGTGSTTVNVTQVNDDPTNVGTLPTDIAVSEDVPSHVDLSAIDLSDVDAASGALTVTLTTSTGGNLFAAAGTGITVGGTSNARTLTGTLTDLNNYLNVASNLTYLHSTLGLSGDNADTIQVHVNDQGNTGSGGGTDIDLGMVNVDINSINDAPTFHIGDGIVTTGIGTIDTGRSVTVQTDGKIIVAGRGYLGFQYDFALSRYNADGTLDTSFGGDGIVSTDFSTTDDFGESVALQTDGKIIVAGYSGNGGNYDFALVRYNADGTLDTSFGGGDGIAVTAVGTGQDIANDVAIQADGKIVVAGYGIGGSSNDFAVVRYNSDGTLDTSFGGGIVLTDINGQDYGHSLLLHGNKILVTGTSSNEFAVARYNSDGTLDTSFGAGNGFITTDIGMGNDNGTDVAVQADGKILITGYSDDGSSTDFATVRYHSDGTLDTSFGGGDGIVTTDVSGVGSFDASLGIATQSDGKIVVSGQSAGNLAVARYLSDGTLDTSFGGSGIVTTTGANSAFDLAIQSDGQIVVTGYSGSDFALVRFGEDGSLDLAFDLVDTLDGNPTFVEGGAAVVLDADVNVSDDELDALNGGNGDYHGSSLTLGRSSGVHSDDVFGFTSGNGITLVGGNLLKNSQIIATFDTISTAGELSVTFTNANGETPTSSDVDNILRQITYANSSDNPPPNVQIDWLFKDGNSANAQGTGGELTATGDTTVDISPVNDAPVEASIEGTALAYTENDGAVAITSTLAVTDVDDTQLESAVVAITAGYNNSQDVLSFTNQNGITGSWNSLTGELTLSGSATLAQYQAALRSVTYTNTSDAPTSATRTVSFTVNDGDVDSNTQSRDIHVQPVNDAPVEASIESTALAYTENDGAVAITSTLAVTDVDDTQLESAVVAITAGYNNSQDILSFTNQNGITGSWNSLTGELTLSGSATLAQYQAALRSVTYTNTSDAPTSATRTVSFTVNDGDVDSTPQSRDIHVQPVNDAPVEASIEGTALAYTENDGAVAITSTLAVTDVDDTQLESAVVAITAGYNNSQDVLSFTNQNGITGSWNSLTGELTLSGSATLAQYQAALRSVTYTNTSDAPTSATRTVSFTVNDGDIDSNTQSRDIHVQPVNDAPMEASIEGTALAYTENDGAVAVTSTPAVTDVDDTHIESAVVAITAGYNNSQDVLSFTNQNGITGSWNSLTGELTLSGSATLAQYQAALRSVTYTNTSDAPTSATRSVSFTVNDGDGDSNTQSRDIHVQPVNDAPVEASIESTALAYTENDGAVAITSTLAITDVDDTQLESAVVAITAGYNNSQDVLSFANQNGITGSWNSLTGELTLSGSATLAQYQAALRSVTYTNTSDAPTSATRTVSFTVNDGDGDSNTQSRDIHVQPVNDAPMEASIESTALAYTENDGAVAITSTLAVTDVDDTQLESAIVAITAGYNNSQDVLSFTNQNGITGSWNSLTGELTLSGSATLAQYQAALRSVTYTNTSDAPTSATRTVSFTVNDGDIDSSPQSRDIHVQPVNDQPTFDIGDGNDYFNPGTGLSSYYNVTVQPDGKTLAVGAVEFPSSAYLDYVLVRYNVDGTLDTTFGGGDGVATLDLEAVDQGFDVTLQEDGKILVAGQARNTSFDYLIVLRYNADGTLDTSFGGGDGIVATDVGVDADQARVVPLSNGKIVLLGTTNPGSGNAVLLQQYNANGTLDTTFGGGDGIVTTTVNGGLDEAQSLAVQNDGKLVVGVTGPSTEFTLLRYNTDGTLDTSFGGGDGQVTNVVGIAGVGRLFSTAIADDGSIFAGGQSHDGTTGYTLLKYDSSGNLDTSFGVGGIARIDNGFAYDIKLQSDGKIVAVGIDSDGTTGPSIVRFNADGTHDTSFGIGGRVVATSFLNSPFSGVDVTPNGKIVAVGYERIGAFQTDAIIYRFNSDGSLDTRFSVVNTLDGNPTFIEGGSPVVLDSDVTLYDDELSNDIDDFNNTTLTLSRSGSANGEDVFSATGLLGPLSEGGHLIYNSVIVGSVTTNSGGTLLLTFNGTADNDAINNVMRSIAYHNTSYTPPTSVQIDWSFNDHNDGGLQGSGGDAIGTGSTTINITQINVAPVVGSVEQSALNYTENDGPLTITSTLSIVDVDDTHIESAVVAITAGYDNSQDVLSFTNQNGINGSWNSLTGELTLSGSATLAEYQAALRSVTYTNTSDAPTLTTRTVSFTVHDGGNDSNTQFRDIALLATNDVPINTGGLPGDVVVTEDVLSNVDLSAINLLDADFPNGGGSPTVTLSTTGGGNLFAAAGTGISITGSNSHTVTLTGTAANLNSYLNAPQNIRYLHPTAHLFGDDADAILVKVNDNQGAPDQHLGSVGVHIAAVNDAPTNSAGFTVAILTGGHVGQDAATGLLVGAMDIDGDPLTAVLMAGPSSGSLTLNADGSWNYTPAAEFFGVVTFQYAVNDGAVNSSTSTITIVVSAVSPPDPPTMPKPEPEPNPEPKPEPEPEPEPEPVPQPNPEPQPEDPDEMDEMPSNNPEATPPGIDPGPTSAILATKEDTPFISPVSVELSGLGVDASLWLKGVGLTGAFTSEDQSMNAGNLDAFEAEEWARLQLAMEQKTILQSMELFEKEIEQRDSQLQVSAGAASSISAGAAAALALWCMSGTYLASLVFSSLPAWMRFDPIYVIQQTTRANDHDETSVADIISGRMNTPPGKVP